MALCVVCADTRRDALLLPCLHSACRRCVADIQHDAQQRSRPATCVVCREIFVPERLLPTLHDDDNNNNDNNNNNDGTDNDHRPLQQEERCSVHALQPLSRFCHQCKKLLCVDCVAAGEHDAHGLCGFVEAAQRFTAALLQRQAKLMPYAAVLAEAVKQRKATQAALKQRLVTLQREINQAFEELQSSLSDAAEALQRRREELLAEAETLLRQDTKTLTLVVENIEVSRELVQLALQQTDAAVRLTPTTDRGTQVLRTKVLVASRLRQLIETQSALAAEGVAVKDNLRFVFPRTGTDHDRNKVSTLGRLLRQRDYTSISTPLRMFGESGSDVGQFRKPAGLACNANGDLVIVDSGHSRIQVMSALGVPLHVMPTPGMIRHVAAAGDGLWLPVREHDMVSLFSMDGTSIRDLTYVLPDGVAFSAVNGDMFVTSGRGVVAAFSADLQQRWSTTLSNSIGALCYSAARDEVFVCDAARNRIDVLSAGDGRVLRQVGVGDINGPTAIAVAPDDHIIVTERRTHSVSVWTLEGDFVHRWGDASQLNAPQGVCVLPDGSIAIADTNNNRIQIF